MDYPRAFMKYLRNLLAMEGNISMTKYFLSCRGGGQKESHKLAASIFT